MSPHPAVPAAPARPAAPSWARARRVATAAALALAALACDRVPAGATRVGALQVTEANLSSAPELGMGSEAARAHLKKALESTRRFAVREGSGEQAARVRLEVESARRAVAPVPSAVPGAGFAAQLDKEQAEVVVSLELLAPAAGDRGEPERLVAEGGARRPTGAEAGAGLDPDARRSAFEAAFEGALREAATALAWQLEARRKPEADLLRDLTAADPRQRDYAVRALADRRSPAAVPALLERLHDESPAVVRRAMGALVAIGDPRAVRPLIELTRKRPPGFVAEIVYALGSLGGPEVEAFLFTLESGAADEEVRRAAREAYSDLRRKREEQAASPRDAGPTARPGTP